MATSQELSHVTLDILPDLPCALTIKPEAATPDHHGYGCSGIPSCGVVLLHGAGGSMDTEHLRRLASMLAGAGWPCVRYTHRSSKVENRAAKLQEVLQALKEQRQLRHVSTWLLAGHSMGARAVCQYAACHPDTAGLILFSYPLHPPNKPEQLRDSPLASLTTPIAWVRGTRDPFCTGAKFDETLPKMSSTCLKVHTVEGGGHSLGQGSKVVSDGELDLMAAALHTFSLCLSHQLPDSQPAAPVRAPVNETSVAEAARAQGPPKPLRSGASVSGNTGEVRTGGVKKRTSKRLAANV